MKILLDEMYPPALATGLQSVGIEATTVTELGLAGRSDADVFAAAVAGGYAVLTENVGDFTPIAAGYHGSGGHFHVLLIALSSRFSRRPAGIAPLVAAVKAVGDEDLEDSIVYLTRAIPDE